VKGRVISIDGPAAAGKSTTAKQVARRLGFCHLNSGLLYRAITWLTLQRGWKETDPDFAGWVRGLDIELVARPPDLVVRIGGRTPGRWLHSRRVSAHVSAVSRHGAVRERVLSVLRDAGQRFDLVCDGRDIGTVVFPDAALKVFLVASADERARRRLGDHGEPFTPDRVERETRRLLERDQADSTRELSPLRRASDAVEIDTTALGPEAVVERILALWEDASSRRHVPRLG
jgi:cytidylate kinase